MTSTHTIRSASELQHPLHIPPVAHLNIRLPFPQTEHWRDNRRLTRDCRLSRRIGRAVRGVQSVVVDLPGVYLHKKFFGQIGEEVVHVSLANLSVNFSARSLLSLPRLVSLSLSRLPGLSSGTLLEILATHATTLQSLTLHSLHLHADVLFSDLAHTPFLPALTRLNIRQTHADPLGIFHLISRSSLLASIVVSLAALGSPSDTLQTYLCHHQYHLFPLLARVHIEGWDWQLHPQMPHQFASLPAALGVDYVYPPTPADVAEYETAEEVCSGSCSCDPSGKRDTCRSKADCKMTNLLKNTDFSPLDIDIEVDMDFKGNAEFYDNCLKDVNFDSDFDINAACGHSPQHTDSDSNLNQTNTKNSNNCNRHNHTNKKSHSHRHRKSSTSTPTTHTFPHRRKRPRPSADRVALAQAVRLLHASAGHLTSAEIDSLISLVDAWNQAAPAPSLPSALAPASTSAQISQDDEYIAVDEEDAPSQHSGIHRSCHDHCCAEHVTDEDEHDYDEDYDEMDGESCQYDDDLDLDSDDEDEHEDDYTDEDDSEHGLTANGHRTISIPLNLRDPSLSSMLQEKRYPVPPSLIRALSHHADRILATSAVDLHPAASSESLFSSSASSDSSSGSERGSSVVSESSPMRDIEARVRNLEGKIDLLALTTTNGSGPGKFPDSQDLLASQLTARYKTGAGRPPKTDSPDLRAKMDFSLMLQREAEALQLEMDNLRSKAGGIMMADLDILD